MTLPGRTHSSTAYRYGFNGMEKDDELKGIGNSYDYGARMLDPRVGRWFAPDNLEHKYSFASTYGFVQNMPLIAIDPDGEDVYIIIRTSNGDSEHHKASITRKNEIEKSKKFDKKKDKVYVIDLVDLNDLSEQIKSIVDDSNNNGYGKTIELSYYGHGGSDGPHGSVATTGPYALVKETRQYGIDDDQLSLKGWSKIDFNFDEKSSIAAFYGCQTTTFAKHFSLIQDVTFTAGLGGKAGVSEESNEYVSNWEILSFGYEDLFLMDGSGVFIYTAGGTKPLYEIYDTRTRQDIIVDFSDYNDRTEHYNRFLKRVKEYFTNFSSNVYVEKDKNGTTKVNGNEYKEKNSYAVDKEEIKSKN